MHKTLSLGLALIVIMAMAALMGSAAGTAVASPALGITPTDTPVPPTNTPVPPTNTPTSPPPPPRSEPAATPIPTPALLPVVGSTTVSSDASAALIGLALIGAGLLSVTIVRRRAA